MGSLRLLLIEADVFIGESVRPMMKGVKWFMTLLGNILGGNSIVPAKASAN